MENRPYILIAGLFVLLLSIGLVTAFWWLSNSHTSESRYRMISLSPVTGLNKQASVRFRGVRVGHVENISLDSNNQLAIIVDISVDNNLKLTKASFGQLAGQGLTGLSYIELNDSGNDKTPLGNQSIPLGESKFSRMFTSGNKMLAHAEKIMLNIDKLLNSLNQVMDDKGRQRIAHLLKKLDQASMQLQPFLQASTATMNEARPSFIKLGITLDEVRPAFVQLNSTLSKIDQISQTVNVETLPRLNLLTHQLTQDAVKFNRLINTLDDNPESIVFGKPAPRPGPAEAGFKP